MLTLSRVMIPCDWIGIVTMRRDMRRSTSMMGMIGRSPGARTPMTWPSRKWTPISYCCTTRIESSKANTAKTMTTIATMSSASMLGTPA